MIRIEVNNKQQIEVTQQTDGDINVDKWDSKNNKTDNYKISKGDFTMLLNYYRHKKENNEEIF